MTRAQTFFTLLIGCVLGSLAILPYTQKLMVDSPEITASSIGLRLVIAALFYGVIILFGMYFSEQLSLKIGWNKTSYLSEIIVGLIAGILVAVSILALDILLFKVVVTPTTKEPGLLYGILASLYGAFNEEVLLRLFLLSAFAWLLRLFISSRTLVMISAIVFSTFFFGMAHLPATANLMPLTATLIIRGLLLNGIAGLTFGYLYWRYNLSTAIWAHLIADILLHGLGPVLLSS